MITTTSTQFKPFEENKLKTAFEAQQRRNAGAADIITPRFPFYVRDRLPVHILENNELYVKFIDAYFEWLGISNGINKIPYLMDINNISSDLLIHHKELFAKLFPETIEFNWTNPDDGTGVDVRRFLSFVRQFYLTKGTEESIRFLLSSLFGLDSASIDFDYPKVAMCFLSDSIWVPNLLEDTDSSGNTQDGYWKDSRTLLGGTLDGSWTDGPRFRDKYYQEFSYSVIWSPDYTDTPNSYKKFNLEPVREIAHPAGFRLFNNVGPTRYIPAGPGPIDTGYSEQPLIGHYLAYNFETTRNPRDPFGGICNTFNPGYDWFPCGFNPYRTNPLGLTGTVNCSTAKHNVDGYAIGYTYGASANAAGYTYTEDTYSTANDRGYTLWVVYHHPNTWSIGPTSGTAFGDMRLGWLIDLIPDIEKGANASPNDPVETLATCSLA